MASSVVTFDVGQTLVDLDLDFLATRLGERGISVDATTLTSAAPAAWRRYDQLTEEGAQHPWQAFMEALLEGAGVGNREPLVSWLYEQQATNNLWRRAIEPMVQVVRDLRARRIKVAALSNSEGHLARLLAEIGLASLFDAIIDSSVVGVAKPDRRIFAIALEQLQEPAPEIVVHVGDSWAADVEGALGAGWHAIWYQSRAGKSQHDPRVPVARNADEVRAALSSLARQAGHPTALGV